MLDENNKQRIKSMAVLAFELGKTNNKTVSALVREYLIPKGEKALEKERQLSLIADKEERRAKFLAYQQKNHG